MKLYRRLIKPVLYYPGQSYEPKKKNLEDPAVWYPEEEQDALAERFKEFANEWNILGFDEEYVEYIEDRCPQLKVPECCKECKSCAAMPPDIAYCHMASIQPNTMQQDIVSSYIKDPDKRPEWCPIVKMNGELKTMDAEKRNEFVKIITGLCALFGSSSSLEWEELEI